MQSTRARGGWVDGGYWRVWLDWRTIACEVNKVGQQLVIGADNGAVGGHREIFVLYDGIHAPSHSLGVFMPF